LIIVVGGGIAGIVSAILLQKKFGKVCLVEQSEKIGGLYRSKDCKLNVTFDYGSHFLQTSGIPELDKIILEEISSEKWLELGNLKGAGYYKSKFNTQTHFLDSRNLPSHIYEKGIVELLSITNSNLNPVNLEDQLYSFFGKTFTNEIFRQILSEKYYGCNLDELSPDTHGIVGLNRILGFTSEASREIKLSKLYDQKFGFHSLKDYKSPYKNYYPKKGGIELWINLLEKKLNSLNIQILTGAKITKIEHDNGTAQSIVFDDGRKLNCTKIIWTVAPSLFLKSSNLLNKNELLRPPKQVHNSLHHFAFDKPFLTDVYFVQCHDPNFKTFRVTLYPNIQKNKNNIYHLTAEVIEPIASDLEELKKKVLSELIQIGIVSKESNLLFQNSELLSNGFPLPTIELNNTNKAYLDRAKKMIKNVNFLGRASGGGFTAGPVLKGVYRTISNLA